MIEQDEYERLKQLIEYVDAIGEQLWMGYRTERQHQCAASALAEAFTPVTLVTIDSMKNSAQSAMDCADEFEGGASECAMKDLEDDIAIFMETLHSEWLAFHSALTVLSQVYLHLGTPIKGLVPSVMVASGADKQSRPNVVPTIIFPNSADWNKSGNIH